MPPPIPIARSSRFLNLASESLRESETKGTNLRAGIFYNEHMKIFWSWQSDTPGKIGRHFIRDVLNDAIAEIKSSGQIEEPDSREGINNLHLDHDIKNVVGSPDLANLIFEKIDASTVFVGDVTTTGTTLYSKKKLINSNVAIELGYALKGLSSKDVLLLLNLHYGSHEDLPFDLRHKGGIIEFNLASDATKEEINSEFKRLKSIFTKALMNYVASAPDPKKELHETPSTFNKASYFTKGEVLAKHGVPDIDEVEYLYSGDALSYIRLIPLERKARPIPIAQLKKDARHAPMLLKNAFNPIVDINHYGVIAFIPGQVGLQTRASIRASTQFFENGEIWLINDTLVKSEHGAEIPRNTRLPFVPHHTFEKTFIDTYELLKEFINTNNLDFPYRLEIGIQNFSNVYLGMNQNETWGPIRKKEIQLIADIQSLNSGAARDAFIEFFNMVIDATGYTRDPNLYVISR